MLVFFIFAAMFISLQVFTRDLKFHKPSQVFYGSSTYNKTTRDYMKYSSKKDLKWDQLSLSGQTSK